MHKIGLFIVFVSVIFYGSAMHESVVVHDHDAQIADEPAFWERQAHEFITKNKVHIVCCRPFFVDEIEKIYNVACKDIAEGNDKKVLEDMFEYTHNPQFPAFACLCSATRKDYGFEQAIFELICKRKLLESLQYMHHAFGSMALDSPDAHFFSVGRNKYIFTGTDAKPLAERVQYLSAALLAQLVLGNELR